MYPGTCHREQLWIFRKFLSGIYWSIRPAPKVDRKGQWHLHLASVVSNNAYPLPTCHPCVAGLVNQAGSNPILQNLDDFGSISALYMGDTTIQCLCPVRTIRSGLPWFVQRGFWDPAGWVRKYHIGPAPSFSDFDPRTGTRYFFRSRSSRKAPPHVPSGFGRNDQFILSGFKILLKILPKFFG